MDQGRHKSIPLAHLLPQINTERYPHAVVDGGKDIRRLRVPDELWDAYTEVVGDHGRSADLRAYIEWRVDNPAKPLPGRRRGPVKRVRNRSADDSGTS